MKFNTSPLQLALVAAYQSPSESLQGAETWWLISTRLCLHQCVSGQVKGLAVTVTHSLWNDVKLCVWDAGSQGHGLSPVPTTQRLCPPPSINRDSHSYIPPIHQTSQHIATGKKERELACYRTRLANLNEEMQQGLLWLMVIFNWKVIFLVSEIHNDVKGGCKKKKKRFAASKNSSWIE